MKRYDNDNNKDDKRKRWKDLDNYRFIGFPDSRRYYKPWYDTQADYNTNAKSYYDYLARYNHFLGIVNDYLNRLLNRDLLVKDTKTIDLTKLGDWLDNGGGYPDNYDDEIRIKADVKVSEETESYKDKVLPNAIKVKDDGLYSRDYTQILDDIFDLLDQIQDKIDQILNKLSELDSIIDQILNKLSELDSIIDQILNKLSELDSKIQNLETRINNKIQNLETRINNKIDKLSDALQKLIDNLYKSGAITSNDINNFEFKPGRNIATGNINLFGGTPDGNSFIRTSKDKEENDITAGID